MWLPLNTANRICLNWCHSQTVWTKICAGISLRGRLCRPWGTYMGKASAIETWNWTTSFSKEIRLRLQISHLVRKWETRKTEMCCSTSNAARGRIWLPKSSVVADTRGPKRMYTHSVFVSSWCTCVKTHSQRRSSTTCFGRSPILSGASLQRNPPMRSRTWCKTC